MSKYQDNKYTFPILIINYYRFCLKLFLSIFIRASDTYKSNEWHLIWEEDLNKSVLDSNTWCYRERRKEDGSRRWHSSNPKCYEFKNGSLVIKGI